MYNVQDTWSVCVALSCWRTVYCISVVVNLECTDHQAQWHGGSQPWSPANTFVPPACPAQMVVSLSVDCPGHAFRHLSSRFEVAALQAVCPCVMLFVSCLVSSSSQRPDPETLVMLCVDVMLCVADPVSFFCPLHCVLLSTAVTLPVWILPGSNLPVMTPISSIASRSVFVTRHTHEHADYDAVRRQSSLSQFQALSLPRVHVAARRSYITLRGMSTLVSTRPPLGTQPSAPAALPHQGL